MYNAGIEFIGYFAVLFTFAEGVGELYAFTARQHREAERLEKEREESKYGPDLEAAVLLPPPPTKKRAAGLPGASNLNAAVDDALASHPLIKATLRQQPARKPPPSSRAPPVRSAALLI